MILSLTTENPMKGATDLLFTEATTKLRIELIKLISEGNMAVHAVSKTRPDSWNLKPQPTAVIIVIFGLKIVFRL